MLVVERGMFISGYLQARFFSSISVAVMGSGSFLFSGLKNFIEKSLNSPSFHISCLISSPTTNTGSKSKKGKSRSIESLAGVWIEWGVILVIWCVRNPLHSLSHSSQCEKWRSERKVGGCGYSVGILLRIILAFLCFVNPKVRDLQPPPFLASQVSRSSSSS